MSDDWRKLEDEAAQKLSEAMSVIQKRRWSNSTQAQRNRQGALLAAGRKRAAKKRRGRKR